MPTTVYTYPAPTEEQIQTHIALAVNVMGWTRADSVRGIWDTGEHIVRALRSGAVYHGIPERIDEDRAPSSEFIGKYIYSYHEWSPSTDPHACQMLLTHVVEKGWRWSVEQITDIQCMCRIYVRTHPLAPERTFVASGYSLEDAFVRATSAVCETLRAENVRF